MFSILIPALISLNLVVYFTCHIIKNLPLSPELFKVNDACLQNLSISTVGSILAMMGIGWLILFPTRKKLKWEPGWYLVSS
ncbi:MAG TPA: hypothetical protein VFV08_01095 [Puia sp.]|nr:hypothetical protein [Puia sp.]